MKNKVQELIDEMIQFKIKADEDKSIVQKMMADHYTEVVVKAAYGFAHAMDQVNLTKVGKQNYIEARKKDPNPSPYSLGLLMESLINAAMHIHSCIEEYVFPFDFYVHGVKNRREIYLNKEKEEGEQNG